MTMSKSHFELIARVLSEAEDDGQPVHLTLYGSQESAAEAMRRTIAVKFSRELARTNPRFDCARFLAACGVES